MTAAVESFDSFRTPNIFEASIAADASHMDSYFTDKMDVEQNDCFDPDSWTLFPQAQGTEDCGDGFGMPPSDFTYPSIVTPPPSAKEAPADWAFAPPKQDASCLSNSLHQIDTTRSVADARFDWGQPTPPDDEGSPSSQFPTATQEHIKQEPDVEQPKPATNIAITTTTTRRKKSEDQGETQAKRRRARKSISVSSSISSSSDAASDPVEEERRNRFLERNRVAASKCRQKKKEWTQNLESHARDLHSSNHQLQVLVTSLKDEVMYLRGEMLKHGSCDCTGIREYLAREADFLASGGSPRTPGSRLSGTLSGRESTVGSPRHSIASTADSRQNLDPVLRNQTEQAPKRKLASERTSRTASTDGKHEI